MFNKIRNTKLGKKIDIASSNHSMYLEAAIFAVFFFALVAIIVVIWMVLPHKSETEILSIGILVMIITFIMAATGYYFARRASRRVLMKETEVRALQNQINSHFMYNVLENIKMMAEIDEEYVISDAITSLGTMFRYNMQWQSGLVTMKEELNYVESYLDLLNLRFEHDISLDNQVPEEFMMYQIPKMTLQPIIENAVRHGIEYVEEDTIISVKASVINDIINLEVTDYGIGIDEKTLNKLNKKIKKNAKVKESEDHGRALLNIQQRVRMYYGNQYRVYVKSKVDEYTRVTVEIPYDPGKYLVKEQHAHD